MFDIHLTYGYRTHPFCRLSVRLPTRRSRNTPPSCSTDCQTIASAPATADQPHTHRPPPYTKLTGTNMGRSTESGAEEEDLSYEETAPANGGQGIKRRYGVE